MSAVREKGTRLGGSMLLSSCVVWRHRDWDEFRRECPGGDEALQRLVWERLDDALDWLCSLGAPVVWQETREPAHRRQALRPAGADRGARARAGEVELGTDGCVDDGRRFSAPGASPPRRSSSRATSSPRRRSGCAATRGRRATASGTPSTAAPR